MIGNIALALYLICGGKISSKVIRSMFTKGDLNVEDAWALGVAGLLFVMGVILWAPAAALAGTAWGIGKLVAPKAKP